MFASLDHCAACYSSTAGAVPPTAALGNDAGFVELRTLDERPSAGVPTRIRIRPRTASGEFLVATVRLEFGDGSVATYRRAFADIDDVHVYAAPGTYALKVWVKGSSEKTAEAVATIAIGAAPADANDK